MPEKLPGKHAAIELGGNKNCTAMCTIKFRRKEGKTYFMDLQLANIEFVVDEINEDAAEIPVKINCAAFPISTSDVVIM